MSGIVDYRTHIRLVLGVDLKGITETQAQTIWFNLAIIDIRKIQGVYNGQDSYAPFYKAFDEVAKILVTAETPDEAIHGDILNLVAAYCTHKGWERGTFADIRSVLRNSANEWKAIRNLKRLEVNVDVKPPDAEVKTDHKSESIGNQISRYREECRLSVESLAGEIGRHPTTVSRHQTGELTPQLRTIAAYERVFSKMLKRQVVIRKTL